MACYHVTISVTKKITQGREMRVPATRYAIINATVITGQLEEVWS